MAEYRLAGYELGTPLVNAAGSINGGNPNVMLDEVRRLFTTAIGAITIGSITVNPRHGNEEKPGWPTYSYNEHTGFTHNAMGLPNIGLDVAERLVPQMAEEAHKHGKPLIVSVAPDPTSAEAGTPYEQIGQLVYKLGMAGADLIEVNASCPNLTEGIGRKPIMGYDLNSMQALVRAIAPWSGTADSKVGIKLPPYRTSEEVAVAQRLAVLFNSRRVFSFITTSNTIPTFWPSRDMPAGLSGPATAEEGRNQLELWRGLLSDTGSDIDIISTLGVHNGQEMATRLDMGATAVGGVSFLWNSRDWGKAVTDMLTDWHNIDSRG